MPGTDIEDLDPELAALMNESTSTSSTQPLKVTVRLHYVHSFEVTTERAQEILKTLMKPVKVILMDVSTKHIDTRHWLLIKERYLE